ncbi:MAG: hypothetical protein LUQ60_07205 [Methanomicrobiales archaeon]|nr:hypothetical protein [Methanomicrobiales archaeon]
MRWKNTPSWYPVVYLPALPMVRRGRMKIIFELSGEHTRPYRSASWNAWGRCWR